MEIPFYIVSTLWIFTIVMWRLDKQQDHKNHMQMLELFKAASLGEFKAEPLKSPSSKNFVRDRIEKAYKRQAEEEGDD